MELEGTSGTLQEEPSAARGICRHHLQQTEVSGEAIVNLLVIPSFETYHYGPVLSNLSKKFWHSS